MTIIYHIIGIPTLFTLLDITKNNMCFLLFIFCLHLIFSYVSLSITTNTSNFKSILTNLSYMFSSFGIFVGLTMISNYSDTILIFSLIMRFISLKIKYDKSINKIYINLLKLLFFCITCKTESIFFTYMYITSLFVESLYFVNDTMNNLNHCIGNLKLGKLLSNNDVNKHLIIWINLKLSYFFHDMYSQTKIFIHVFHNFFGLILLLYFFGYLTEVKFLIPVNWNQNIKQKIFLLFLIFFIIIVLKDLNLFLATVLLFFVITYSFVYNNKLPKKQKILLAIFDGFFVMILIKNILTYYL